MQDPVALAIEALWLATALSLPVVLAAAAVGFVTAVLQAATQIQDHTLAHLPRFLAVVAVLALTGGWIGREIGDFAERSLAAVAAPP